MNEQLARAIPRLHLLGLVVATTLILAAATAPAQATGAGFGVHLGHGHYGSHHGISIGYGHGRHRSHAGFHYGYRHHGYGYGHRRGHSHGHRHHRYYPRYRYGYGYRYGHHRSRHYGYPYRSDHYGHYSSPIYSGGSLSSAGSLKPGGGEEGWRLLAEGKAIDAASVFGRLAEANRSDGKLKAGYALAIAAAGDLERGVWAMRRAFRVDPDALHYVPVDDELADVMDDLIARYEDTRDHSLAQQDADFMTAAMYYLRHDNEAAGSALDEEDVSQSAVNLKRLLTAPTG
ncbi:MAG: hypothetical protein ACR2RB_10845 [Gammaproteobacteria bacterium]